MENLQQLLGPMSPLSSASGPTVNASNTSDGSVSFTKGRGTVGSAGSMSTSSGRPPFADMKNTTSHSFEFKPVPLAAPKAASMSAKVSIEPPAPPTTPLTPASVVGGTAETPAPHAKSSTPVSNWLDVLLWKAPLPSALYFASGLALLGVVTWLLYGDHGVSLTSGIAYLALADLMLNFLRFFISTKWQNASLWVGSEWTARQQARLCSWLSSFAALHDAYLSSLDPVVTLRVATSLWAVAWLGNYFSVWSLVVGGYIAAFTLPALYLAKRAAVDASLRRLHAATWAHVDKLEMPRTSRLLATLLALGALLVVAPWTQFVVGVFVSAAYWRSTLVPHEVDAIREAAAPYTQSVRKAGKRLSLAMDDVMVRYSGAPSTRTKSHFA